MSRRKKVVKIAADPITKRLHYYSLKGHKGEAAGKC